METILLIIFVVGYLAITLEHSLRVDKLVPALTMMALLWAIVAFGLEDFRYWFDSANHKLLDFTGLDSDHKHHLLDETLLHHLGKTSEILIFLIGAMTIVEITDYFKGFSAIKRFVRTNSKGVLLWIISILAFILSAIIDNLTATIVLITILRKILDNPKDRLWFAGMIVIAANAGGAWSPIGDVTTTMLWIGKKVSALMLVEKLLLPSFVCMALPTLAASFMPVFKGKFEMEKDVSENKVAMPMLLLGLGSIIFVPIFKTVTHLPPYVGMMLSLSIVSIVAEIISNRNFTMGEAVSDHSEHAGPVHLSLSKIEIPSILFFLGILMAVAALESLGMLFNFAEGLQQTIPDQNIVVMLLGAGSAVIDNVPLVAASMGMFISPMDSPLWHFIAYAAGTGGSMLIIGSAAGVVAMGMEKISFFWYLKNITWLAVIGYLGGASVFLLMN